MSPLQKRLIIAEAAIAYAMPTFWVVVGVAFYAPMGIMLSARSSDIRAFAWIPLLTFGTLGLVGAFRLVSALVRANGPVRVSQTVWWQLACGVLVAGYYVWTRVDAGFPTDTESLWGVFMDLVPLAATGHLVWLYRRRLGSGDA